jgi:DNA repair protein REV1
MQGKQVGWSTRKEYFKGKSSKLKEQFQEKKSEIKSTIFEKFTFFVDGYTTPNKTILKELILTHGGNFEQYLSKKKVTHIIAMNITVSKIQEFK